MGTTVSKKVLVITYYWPPAGGVAVQRWLKFVKYLRSYGWEPIVYTPENPENFYEDTSLQRDIPDQLQVLKTRIWEPYNIYKWLTGRKNEKLGLGFADAKKGKGPLDHFMVWLRGNLLIPDPRMFWVNPSVRFLSGYIRRYPVDAIVTTGPPHSLHLIGLKLKRKLHIPWLADFRDPWTNIDYYSELHLTILADWLHRRLERKVLRLADATTVVSQQMRIEFEKIRNGRVAVIPNGFDSDDIPKIDIPKPEGFTITYVGTMNKARNPEVLWKALGNICSLNKEFAKNLVITIAGQVDASVEKSLRENDVWENYRFMGTIPHNEAMALLVKSSVLLLVVNNAPNAKGIVTGKFFEYLATGHRILAIGPTDGDLANILKQTGAGQIIDYNDIDGAKQIITHYYQLYKSNSLELQRGAIDTYSRKALTGQLANTLNKLIDAK